ncbi:MAG: hypothetical protein RIS44_3210 [Pseudomonadota bacterium]|jgi:DNA-binding NarL/FixJ family response regulator
MPLTPTSPAITVAVVEDLPTVREALQQALANAPGIRLLEMCTDQPAGLALVQRECPDVLLVDLGLPSGSGLQVIRTARLQWGSRCASAVLTETLNIDNLQTAVAAGAKGHLFKLDPPDEWLPTIHRLATGQSTMTSALAKAFLTRLQATPRATDCALAAVRTNPTRHQVLSYAAEGATLADTALQLNITEQLVGQHLRAVYDAFQEAGPELSPREFEYLQLLNKGITQKECAPLMGVELCTIKTYSNRAFEKLGVNNLQAALYEARKAGLLS